MSYFLLIEGIDGSSLERAHKDWHDVLAFSWGVSQSASPTGGGGGAGRPTLEPLNLSVPFGPAMPPLFDLCVTGRAVPKVVLEVTKDGDKPLVILKIEMHDVMMSSLSLAGPGGDEVAESFALTYRSITFTATGMDETGKATPPVTASWDGARGGRGRGGR